MQLCKQRYQCVVFLCKQNSCRFLTTDVIVRVSSSYIFVLAKTKGFYEKMETVITLADEGNQGDQGKPETFENEQLTVCRICFDGMTCLDKLN